MVVLFYFVSTMDRVRNFTESELSADDKKAIRLLVSKKVLDPSVWTEENFTKDELLQVCKDALRESQGTFPSTAFHQ